MDALLLQYRNAKHATIGKTPAFYSSTAVIHKLRTANIDTTDITF